MTLAPKLDAGVPWFGNKRQITQRLWDAFGSVDLFVDAFGGSAAVLFGRPEVRGHETYNDRDGYLCNYLRAARGAPEAMAELVDYPVVETDLYARHRWLIEQGPRLLTSLEADPDWFDAKIAAYWAWGLSCWIGDGWCARLTRKLPNCDGMGDKGLVSLTRPELDALFARLARRLRNVRILCGDWTRPLAKTALRSKGWRAVCLDPPYAEGGQQYTAGGTGTPISARARAWALEHGRDPRLRIALCGRGDEHAELEGVGWRVEVWSAKGGYGQGEAKEDRHAERIWFSPHCLTTRQCAFEGL